MSRGHEPEEHLDPRVSPEERERNPGDPPKPDEVREQASSDASQSRDREPDGPGTRTAEARTVYELRSRTYRLRNSEIATMVELGKFRAIAKKDLAEFAYRGEGDRMRPDIENLFRQDLVEIKWVPHQERGPRELLALTRNGHRLLRESQSAPEEQALYHGFSRPREAHHDADLYRVYHRAAEKIAAEGGWNLRVVLDYEIKSRLNHDLAKLGKDGQSPDGKRPVAEQHGLQAVGGKIPVPDVRIEYETQDGQRARVDLELATAHYRGESLAEKVAAGFSLYAHADDFLKLRRLLDQHGLPAELYPL